MGQNYLLNWKKMLLITYYSFLVVILWERANTCSIKLSVSRTLKYPVWFISSLNKMVFILLIFPHTKASSFSSPGCRIFFCLLCLLSQRVTKKMQHSQGGSPIISQKSLSISWKLSPFCLLSDYLFGAEQSSSFQEFCPESEFPCKSRQKVIHQLRSL